MQVHDFYVRNKLRVLEIPVGVKCPIQVGWPNINKPVSEVNECLQESKFNKYGWLLDDTHLVLDIDLHNDEENGLDSLNKLQQDVDVDFYETCEAIVRTPSGGLHFYFTKPDGFKFGKTFKERYPGIDFIHGKGKQVVAANSSHDSYPGHYSLDEPAMLVPIPQHVLDYLVSIKPVVAAESSFSEPTSDRAGDDFNKSSRGLQIMCHALAARGYTVRKKFDFWEFDRPGKQTSSDCSGHVGKKSKQGNYQLTCFSLSDASFPSGEPMTIFYAYALLLHHGNSVSAAQDLFSLGFAPQPEVSSVDLSGFMLDAADTVADAEPQFPMECLDEMPEYLRLAYEYSRANSILFMPDACLMGLLALFSTILGRRIRDDYNTRTNPIIITLAGSGSGKNAQRSCNKNLLVASGLTRLSGPERIGSAQGIVTAVHNEPSILFQLDEAGELLKAINNPRGHLQLLPGLMMHMYSDASSTWTSDAVADPKRVKTIHQPNPVYYGTATPDSFYSNVTDELLIEGFMNRMFIIRSSRPGRRNKPSLANADTRLLSWMRSWASLGSLGGGGNMEGTGVEIPQPRLIRKTDEASQLHESYTDTVIAKHARDSTVAASLWARAPEKEAKLALVHACSSSLPEDSPMVTGESIRWAKKLVNFSTRWMIWAAGANAGNSSYMVLKQKVINKIEDGISRSQLCRRTQFLRQKERQEIINDLQESGLIRVDGEGRFFKV